MMHILLNNGLKCGLLFILLFGLGVNSTQAQFHYEIPLTTQVKPDDLIIGGDAMLTSGGADLQGQGWLRLTPDEITKKGGLISISLSHPSWACWLSLNIKSGRTELSVSMVL